MPRAPGTCGDNAMIRSSFQSNRAERLIATGRVILAATALSAVWLDPTEPARYVLTTYAVLAGYLLYAVVMALAAWYAGINWTRPALVVHAVDLLVFAILMFLTTGPAGPFFQFFVFSLVCAALRWQMRGTMYTAATALGIVILMTVYPAELLRDPDFELDRFLIHIGYLLVVAVLLGYMGAYERERREKIARLAVWPAAMTDTVSPLMRESLAHASAILAAPRVLAVWQVDEEPQLHVALWSPGEFSYTREPPDAFGSLVAGPLAEADFLCRDPLAPMPSVLHTPQSGWQRWHGLPLNPELQRRFSIKTVLALSLQGESVTGRLLVLDKARLTSDDLVSGIIVARQVSNDLEHFHLLKRLRHAAATEEHVRLARDLHDGLLQSLTGASVQLETVRPLMETDPETARQRLLDVQELISAEKVTLHSHIRQLKPSYPDLPEQDGNLADRMMKLAGRIEQQWGPRVTLDVTLDPAPLPWTAAQEIYFIINEALVNAACQAGATTVRAEVTRDQENVRIVIADNGRGFPFRGRHDLPALTEMNLGPLTLKERVASLGGTMTIESGGSGAILEIGLPITEKES